MAAPSQPHIYSLTKAIPCSRKDRYYVELKCQPLIQNFHDGTSPQTPTPFFKHGWQTGSLQTKSNLQI